MGWVVIFGIFIVGLISAWYFGYVAFRTGLSVKRWTLMGLILGPLAFPLFTAHNLFALRKVRGYEECILNS